MINPNSKNLRDIARLFNDELSRIKQQTQQAKDSVSTNYSHTIQLAPLYARCSKALTDYAAHGVTIDDIGLMWSVDYNENWTDIKPSFDLLYTNIKRARVWLPENSGLFKFTINEIDGARLYNVDLPIDKKSELIEILDSILSSF